LCVLSCGGETRKHDDSAVYKEGEILVKFRQTASEINKDAAHRMLGAQVIKKVKIEGVERIGLPVHLSVEEAVRLCRQNPDVEYAEPNYLVRAAVIPDDPRFNEQWYLLNTGQTVNGTAGTVDADIDAPESWEITQGIPSVVVAVIDSGVDKNHPDIKDNLLTGYDFVDEDNDPADLNGHGTHVAGIIGAAANNAQGVAGIAWKPRVMPLRALDQKGEGTIGDVVDAIAFAAANDAKIINMSFAGPSYSQTLYNSIKAYPDILFVAAAGNEGAQATGNNNDVIPLYPASFELPNILSVTATDQNDSLSRFANTGLKSVDIAAPGEKIVSTIPSFITGVTYSGLYKVIYLAFGFEGINGASTRREVMQRAVIFSGISGDKRILIVDDDGGSSYERYYTDTLQALGYPFDVYQILLNGDGPSADMLSQYGLVIWFTGDEYRNTLTPADQVNLRSYLLAGGTSIITGQEIGFDIGQSDFYMNYLHAYYVSDNAYGKYLTGADIFGGLKVDISRINGDGAANQFFVDAVFPLGSAKAFSIQYDDAYEFFDGTSMSTAVVSGAAALVASYYERFSAHNLKSVILNSVDIKQSLQGKILTGGRLNAQRAITSLLPPSELSANPEARGKVLLTWTDNSTAEQGFIVERKRPGDQFREIATVSSGVTTYADRGLEAGTFLYRVRGFVDQAQSFYSNEISVTVQDGARSHGGGGGGGCSLGKPADEQTAAADTIVLLTPVFIVWAIRMIRFRGGRDSIRQGSKDSSDQGFK
jgi:subtilisin family serine protease